MYIGFHRMDETKYTERELRYMFNSIIPKLRNKQNLERRLKSFINYARSINALK